MAAIRGLGGGAPLRGVRGGAGRGPGGFSLGATAREATAAGAAQGPAATAAVGLLALQETAPAAERDARARRRGEAMLKELAALQRDLLGGRCDPARLGALAALAEGEAGADPALAAAVGAIALRVRVELARRMPVLSVSRD